MAWSSLALSKRRSDMKTAEHIYSKFAQFEEQAATIYLLMASHFCPQNPELAALWLDMGMQEKEHAGLLQFCILERLSMETQPTEQQILTIEGVFADLARRAASPRLSIHEAFEIAVEMETSEVNEIYSYLTTPLHNSMYMLRRKIAASMPHHTERLLKEGRTYGVPEVVLSTLAKSSGAIAPERL